MNLQRWIMALAAAWQLLAGVAARADAPLPAAAYGALPAMSTVRLSPGGRYVAWIDGSAAARVILYDLDDNHVARTVQTDTALKLRDLAWCDDDVLIVEASLAHVVPYSRGRRYEFFRHLTIDRNTGSSRILLLDEGRRTWLTSAELLSACRHRPGRVLMAALTADWQRYRQQTGTRLAGGQRNSVWVDAVFEVDPRSGEETLVEIGSPFTEGWVLAADGQPLARADYDAGTKRFSVLALRDGSWTTLLDMRDAGLGLAGRSVDGQSLLLGGTAGGERSKLWSLPLAGGALVVAFEDPANDVEGIVHDARDDTVIGVQLGGLAQQRHLLPGLPQARREAALAKAFPGREVAIGSRSADGKRVIAWVGAADRPASWYLVDYARGGAELLGESRPALAGAPPAEVRQLTYPARDQYPVPAYLTLPPQREPRGLPTVVLPHGGPESRDDAGFDYLAQFLASRGYAVLQPQFRGSTGFGAAHRDAGYRQWGKRMQDDVSDGVAELVKQGIADPQRVCIVGASYGGYSALAGAAFTPELYACAASIGGVSDLPALHGYVTTRSGRDSATVDYWREHIGLPNDPAVIAASPARAADNVRAPVLLLHGEHDTVVPPRQSEVMAAALRKAGKPHRLVLLPGEDHWLSTAATRTRVLEELERFLAEHLAARRAPAAEAR